MIHAAAKTGAINHGTTAVAALHDRDRDRRRSAWPRMPGTRAIRRGSRSPTRPTAAGATAPSSCRGAPAIEAFLIAQVAARAGLPPDQGDLGLPREPHRRALRLRMARRQRTTGFAATATRTGSSTSYGLMRRRHREHQRRADQARMSASYHWPLGRRPDDHPVAERSWLLARNGGAAMTLLERHRLHARRQGGAGAQGLAWQPMRAWRSGGSWETRITAELADFIAAQTSVFLATANRRGPALYPAPRRPTRLPAGARRPDHRLRRFRRQPPVHHARQSGREPKAHLFLIDYARRQRVKIWGEARVVEDDAELTARLMPQGLQGAPVAGRSFSRSAPGTPTVPSTFRSASTPPTWRRPLPSGIGELWNWKRRSPTCGPAAAEPASGPAFC